MIFVALIVVLGLGAVVFMYLYNSLINLQQRVKNAWSQIDVQLKRRHDLIPNLVETVKGYAAHERLALENVIKARNQAVSASSIGEKTQAENFLTQSLRSLFAVTESYPDLKANKNFLQLQEELTTTENRIAFARQFYNDEVMNFNSAIKTAPRNFIANSFGLNQEAEFLKIEDPKEKEAPQVKF
ncbi:MAG: LemA family protein [Elusimicrobiota bacterium]